MLFAADQNGMYSPLERSGEGGSPEIRALQNSLGKLAVATGRTTSNPGVPTGIIGEKTMVSIASLLDKISIHLPMWVVHPLQSALMQGVSSGAAKNTASQYVTEIRWAADKATVLANQLQPPFPEFQSLADSTTDTSFFADGWFLMPSRLFVLGGILLLGIWAVSHLRRAGK